MTFRFAFRPVARAERALVHSWLAKPHIAEWFYGDGLQNTYRHLDEFLEGAQFLSYWLACDGDHPFAFLITSVADESENAITLDIAIGDEAYLGKGLAQIVIREFLLSQFGDVEEVLIDPEATNLRAVHVYEKVGFSKIRTFVPSHSPHPHYMMRLKMKDLN